MKWLVLGGWAIPPEICTPIFLDNAMYVDTNLLAPDLCADEMLAIDWIDRLHKVIAPYITHDIDGIAGFSMGSLMAIPLAHRLNLPNLLLLSGTACFCRRIGNPYGWKPAIIDSMRSRLHTNFNDTLNDFLARCGETTSYPERYSLKQLNAGLLFLRDASVLNIPAPAPRILACHGNMDTIIPVQAAQEMQKKWHTHLELFDGGHLFFTACADSIRERINKRNHHASI